MRIQVGDVAVAAGVLLTAPGMAGMCCTILGGHSPHELAVAMVALGLVLAIAGLVPRFEQHQDGWRRQSEALLRARQQSQRATTVPDAHEPAAGARVQLTRAAPRSRAPIPR